MQKRHTHRSGIAGSGGDLLAVRDGEVGDGSAEVNEVVRRGQGSDLAGSSVLLAIQSETGGDDRLVES